MKGEESLPDTTTREDMAPDTDPVAEALVARAAATEEHCKALTDKIHAAYAAYRETCAKSLLEEQLVLHFGFKPGELDGRFLIQWDTGVSERIFVTAAVGDWEFHGSVSEGKHDLDDIVTFGKRASGDLEPISDLSDVYDFIARVAA